MNGPRHAFGLDVLRAVAVGCVLLAHGALFHTDSLPGARYVLITCGVLGVEIFFALSGFLVGRQLLGVAAGEASAWRFVQRRWWRTLPNYYLFLAINAALVAWVVTRQGPDARFLVFAQALAWPASSAFFPESWSLAVEEWFYGLGALGFALAAWRRATPAAIGWGLVALLVAGPLARWVVQGLAPLEMDAGVRKMCLVRLDALAFGLGAAWLERHAPRRFAAMARPAWLAAAGCIVAACLAWLGAMAVDLAFFGPARSAAERVIASLAFTALPLAAALAIPWLTLRTGAVRSATHPVSRVAAWSYSIYLVHFPLLLAMLQHWPAQGVTAQAVRTAAWLVATLAIAAGVHHAWELPMMRRRPPLAPGAS